MAFDPYTNVETMELFKRQNKTDELTQDKLKKYYKLPVMCLLRIKDSIDIKSRVEDIHEAFADDNVKMIITSN